MDVELLDDAVGSVLDVFKAFGNPSIREEITGVLKRFYLTALDTLLSTELPSASLAQKLASFREEMTVQEQLVSVLKAEAARHEESSRKCNVQNDLLRAQMQRRITSWNKERKRLLTELLRLKQQLWQYQNVAGYPTSDDPFTSLDSDLFRELPADDPAETAESNEIEELERVRGGLSDVMSKLRLDHKKELSFQRFCNEEGAKVFQEKLDDVLRDYDNVRVKLSCRIGDQRTKLLQAEHERGEMEHITRRVTDHNMKLSADIHQVLEENTALKVEIGQLQGNFTDMGKYLRFREQAYHDARAELEMLRQTYVGDAGPRPTPPDGVPPTLKEEWMPGTPPNFIPGLAMALSQPAPPSSRSSSARGRGSGGRSRSNSADGRQTPPTTPSVAPLRVATLVAAAVVSLAAVAAVEGRVGTAGGSSSSPQWTPPKGFSRHRPKSGLDGLPASPSSQLSTTSTTRLQQLISGWKEKIDTPTYRTLRTTLDVHCQTEISVPPHVATPTPSSLFKAAATLVMNRHRSPTTPPHTNKDNKYNNTATTSPSPSPPPQDPTAAGDTESTTTATSVGPYQGGTSSGSNSGAEGSARTQRHHPYRPTAPLVVPSATVTTRKQPQPAASDPQQQQTHNTQNRAKPGGDGSTDSETERDHHVVTPSTAMSSPDRLSDDESGRTHGRGDGTATHAKESSRTTTTTTTTATTTTSTSGESTTKIRRGSRSKGPTKGKGPRKGSKADLETDSTDSAPPVTARGRRSKTPDGRLQQGGYEEPPGSHTNPRDPRWARRPVQQAWNNGEDTAQHRVTPRDYPATSASPPPEGVGASHVHHVRHYAKSRTATEGGAVCHRAAGAMGRPPYRDPPMWTVGPNGGTCAEVRCYGQPKRGQGKGGYTAGGITSQYYTTRSGYVAKRGRSAQPVKGHRAPPPGEEDVEYMPIHNRAPLHTRPATAAVVQGERDVALGNAVTTATMPTGRQQRIWAPM